MPFIIIKVDPSMKYRDVFFGSRPSIKARLVTERACSSSFNFMMPDLDPVAARRYVFVKSSYVNHVHLIDQVNDVRLIIWPFC